MKRALLITGGTVAGVAAVLSYTPAQLSSANAGVSPTSGGATINSGTPSSAPTQTPAQTSTDAQAATSTRQPSSTSAASPTSAPKSTTSKKKSSSSTTASSSGGSSTQEPANTPAQTPTQTPTQTSTQTPTQTPAPAPTQKPASANMTVTGRGYGACRFGTVAVQISVANGSVTAAKAVSYPSNDGRSAWISQQAIPWLVEQTLAAKNSANIAGVGGATCTTNAWIQSLQSALTAAGL